MVSLFWIPKVRADSKYSLLKETYENAYYVQNGMPDHYGSDAQFKFTINGKIAFCMDPISAITKYEYYGIPLGDATYDAETQEYLNKIIYYGYDYYGHQNANYYMATQALIWERISPYLIEFYTERYGYGNYIDVSNEKNEIIRLANNHNSLPYFANQTYNYNLTNYLEFEDNILNEFEIVDSNWQNILIENNKLKINNLDNFVGTINIKLKKKTYRNDNPMYYYEDGTQALITGGKPDDIITEFSVKINGAKIKVNKLDNISNLPIKDSNIKFNIINKQTNEYVYVNGTKDIPINSEGYLITDSLPYGEYRIIEVATIDEYELSEFSFSVLVNQDTVNEDGIYDFNFYNTLKRGNINITKVDKNSKRPLAGIKFGLYALEDIRTSDGILHYSQNQLVDEGITDDNGELKFKNLIYGNYYLKELSTIDGYIIDINRHKVFLRNKEYNIKLENELEKGSITINKLGEYFNQDTLSYELKSLANVEFTLIANEDIIAPEGTIYYKKGDVVSVKNTDQLGMLEFNNLVLGDYCFIETKTLDEYMLDSSSNCYDLKIYHGLSSYQRNYLKRGTLKLNKLDKDSNLPIKNSNIKFNIKNIETGQYILINNEKDLVINNEGYLLIDNLPYGTYEITEINDNPIYEVNNQSLKIKINEKTINSENLVEANFYNKLKKGKISILKKGEKFNFKTLESTFSPLSDIEFTLIANADIITGDLGKIYSKGDIIAVKKSNSNGKIEFANLVLGSYCVKETNTLNNYILDENIYCFNLLENENQQLELANYLKKGTLKLNKLDSISKLSIKNSNIKFNIKNLDSNRYIYIDGNKDLMINEDGYLIIENLPYGTYEIKEISTTNEYLLNKESLIIEINDSKVKNNILEINFYNDLKRGQIIVNKKGEIFNYEKLKYNYEYLSNIEFTLKAAEDIVTKDGIKHYSNGDIVSITKTNEKGQIIFDNLILGNYCLIESKTKEDYILDSNTHCFNLNEKEQQEIDVINYLQKNDLKIIKVDGYTNKPISGVTFEIYYHDISLGKFKTDKNGKIELKNIPTSIYKIQEIKTKNNYILDNKIYQINLKLNQEITIENQKKVDLPNTKLNDYSLNVFGGIMLIGLILYGYSYKKKNL